MKIPEEMRKKYAERRARDAEALERALEQNNFDVLSKVGHQLKGNAATFGYEPLAELGRKMELAVENRSMADAKQCLFALKAWLQEQTSGVGEDG
jgi:HPt (histidine-containing phosphotransfer) domain-containing protein